MSCGDLHPSHLHPRTPLRPPQRHVTAHRVRVLCTDGKPANNFSAQRWRKFNLERRPQRVANRGLT